MADVLGNLRDAQREAATAMGREIIVTAGAGTGKTTTLSARTLVLLQQSLLGRTEPTSIDRFLIITFTRNAAAEMRERITRQLDHKVREERGNPFWLSQRAAMHRAAISTLDSFCLDVLKTYAHDTGLDPEFQPMNADDAEMLESEALVSVFESLYADPTQRGEHFRALAASLGGREFDGELFQRVRALHTMRQTQPHSELWMERIRQAAAQLPRWRSDPRSPWYRVVEEQFMREISHLEADVNRAAHWANRRGIGLAYEEFLIAVQNRVRNVLQPDGRPLFWKFADRFPPADSLPRKGRSIKLKDEDKALVGTLVDSVRKRIRDIQNGLLPLVDPALDSLMGANAQLAVGLLDVVDLHAERYSKRKAEERVVDFADIEQQAYRLLDTFDHVRSRLRNRFEQVMVDEVQDINRLQDSIIQHVAAHDRRNLFLVGDVKQSIYGFRLAQPELLSGKLERAADPGTPTPIQRVDLKENFRSRTAVVRAVNALFGQLMQPELGGIPYDDRARLEARARGFPGEDPDVMLSILEKPAGSDNQAENDNEARRGVPDSEVELLASAEREAIHIARELQRLLAVEPERGPSLVLDTETHLARPARPRDIAILLRSPRTVGEVFVNCLRRVGIDVFAELGGGYLSSPEIRDVESTLQALENPRQDVPLASYLTGAIGGATYSDLVRARRLQPQGALVDSIRSYIADGESGSPRQRIEEAMARLDGWRRDACRKSLPDLLWGIIHGSGYFLYASCQPLGVQRRANLLDFAARARQFSGFHTQGLSRFLRYLEHLREREDRIQPPSPLSGNDDVIRLMSVHAAKGLEFPIVVLPQLGRRFNLRDASSGAVIDRDFGPCLNLFVERTGVKLKSLPRELASQRQRLRDLAEELRIWYVAMTRARERLILAGTAAWTGQPWKWCGAYDPKKKCIPAGYLEKCVTPLDWFVPAAMASGAWFAGHDVQPPGLPQTANPPVKLRRVSPDSLQSQPEIDNVFDVGSSSISEASLEPDDQRFVDDVMAGIRWRYPYESVHDLSAKATITDIKHAMASHDVEAERPHRGVLPPPPFRDIGERTRERDAARRGIATHRFLELMDLRQTESVEDIRKQREKLVNRQVLSHDEADLVDLETVSWFFSTSPGREMSKCWSQVYRECPFTLAARSGEIWPDRCGDAQDELVHIQGVVDAMIVGEQVTILDYKTDRIPVEAAETYARRYHIQLQLYARAARTILDRPLGRVLLVFLAPKTIVEVPVCGGHSDENVSY